MSGRYGLRLWIAGVLFAVLGGLGAVAWLAMTPADRDGHAAKTSLHREADGLPSFEAESHAPEPMSLAAPAIAEPAVPQATPVQSPEAGTKPDAAPRRIAVTVVNGDGRAVAGATVLAFAEPKPLDSEAILKEVRAANPDGTGNIIEQIRAALERHRDPDPSWADPLGAWTTDAAGSVIVDVPGDVVQLMAEHEDEGTSGLVKLASLEQLQGTEPRPTLTLSPRGTLKGRVVTVDGAPASGAMIVFTPTHMPNEGSRARLPQPLSADADGRFSVVVDTKFFSSIHAELGGQRTVEEYAHVWPDQVAEMELRFPGAFSITGVVLGPDGAPVHGAQISVTGWRVHADKVKSDAQGRFQLPLTRACRVGLVAEVEGLAQSEAATVTVSESEPSTEIELRMEPAASISGFLRDGDGQPIARVTVTASVTVPDFDDPLSAEMRAWTALGQEEHDFQDSFRGFAQSDAEGRFLFKTLHPGSSYSLSAYQRGEPSLKAHLEPVAAGATDVVLALKVPETVSIQGRVVDASTRSALSPCKLTCFDWSNGPMAIITPGYRDVVDADAQFRIEGLAPGREVGFLVEAVNYPPTKLGPFKPGDEPIELAVGKHAAFSILVTDASGTPQPGASIQLIEGVRRGFGVIFGNLQVRTADADGRIVWQTLPPGTYSLEAVSGSMRSPRGKIELPPGTETPVHLVVAAVTGGGRLEIVVRRSDDRPWPAAVVKAVLLPQDEDAEGELEAVHMGETDQDGRVVLEGLSPGFYVADVINADVLVPIGRAEVTAGDTATMELRPKD